MLAWCLVNVRHRRYIDGMLEPPRERNACVRELCVRELCVRERCVKERAILRIDVRVRVITKVVERANRRRKRILARVTSACVLNFAVKSRLMLLCDRMLKRLVGRAGKFDP